MFTSPYYTVTATFSCTHMPQALALQLLGRPACPSGVPAPSHGSVQMPPRSSSHLQTPAPQHPASMASSSVVARWHHQDPSGATGKQLLRWDLVPHLLGWGCCRSAPLCSFQWCCMPARATTSIPCTIIAPLRLLAWDAPEEGAIYDELNIRCDL